MRDLFRRCFPAFMLVAALGAGAEIPQGAEAAEGQGGGAREVAESIGAIDRDLDSIDDLAAAILGETAGLEGDNERLRAAVDELRGLNGEAAAEIARLNDGVASLAATAELLGRRYDEAVGMAQRYKDEAARHRALAIGLGAATVVLGGALLGAAAAR